MASTTQLAPLTPPTAAQLYIQYLSHFMATPQQWRDYQLRRDFLDSITEPLTPTCFRLRNDDYELRARLQGDTKFYDNDRKFRERIKKPRVGPSPLGSSS